MNKILTILTTIALMFTLPAYGKEHRKKNNNGFASGVAAGILGTIVVHKIKKDVKRHNRHQRRNQRFPHSNRHQRFPNRHHHQRFPNEYRYDRCLNIRLKGLRGSKGSIIVRSNHRYNSGHNITRVSKNICVNATGQYTIIHDRNYNNIYDYGDGISNIYVNGRSQMAYFKY